MEFISTSLIEPAADTIIPFPMHLYTQNIKINNQFKQNFIPKNKLRSDPTINVSYENEECATTVHVYCRNNSTEEKNEVSTEIGQEKEK